MRSYKILSFSVVILILAVAFAARLRSFCSTERYDTKPV